MSLLRTVLLVVYLFIAMAVLGQSRIVPGVSHELAVQRRALLSKVRYQLHFNVPGQQEKPIQGKAVISFVTNDHHQQVILDFKGPDSALRSLLVNGQEEAIDYRQEHLFISTRYLVKGLNRVTIVFEAGNAALNRNADYLYTLFVPDRARTVFPCFDQPDLKAVFTLSLRLPDEWTCLSNAPVKQRIPQGAYTRWQFNASDIVPTYLFSFAAGRFTVRSKKVHGRIMNFFYRETDSVKLASSLDAIFELHAQSLSFLEKYTGIPFPFRQFSFAAIPDFQFGGMEHPGAIWYNAGSLFLDSSATRTQLIRRANLVAHETAHMWFGDLVTMTWFNDVWMKEVFANFIADKIVSVNMPEDNADLQFITQHYPAAYAVDRTKGANPIGQPLNNLNQAGTLYGAIIYHKAPIMMQRLERRIGAEALQRGLRIYLRRYAFGNAGWPDLIRILDDETSDALVAWNDRWVNSPGRPVVHQFLTDARGDNYGLFEVDTASLSAITLIKDPALRAFSWLNLYENMLEGNYLSPMEWIMLALKGLKAEKEELISQMLLNELQTAFWIYLSPQKRMSVNVILEGSLRDLMSLAAQPRLKKSFFNAWAGVSLSDEARQLIYNVWKLKAPPTGVLLSEDDYSDIAAELAIKRHPEAASILQEQLSRIKNPDKIARWQFLLPSLSGNEQVRDTFFASLLQPANRRKESWVAAALSYLHHPLRENSANKYILPSLDLLTEIQRTGDIFFPDVWLEETLGAHQSAEAEKIVLDFMNGHPGYDRALLLKLLQASDPLFRARKIAW